VTYKQEIAKLTVEDIKRVAGEYFRAANRTVVVLKREDAS
jgi:predicted Zn-dependent peptidase